MEKGKLICVVLLFLLGCTSVRVQNREATPGFALSNYQTFAFYDVSATEVSASGDTADHAFQNQVNLVKEAIRQQLTAKGLRYAPTQADLLVNIGVVTREKVQTRQTDFRTDAPRYIGQRRYSWQSKEVEVGRYKEGTVTIDLVDRQKNDLVWKGTVAAIIPRQQARQQKTVADGVAKLFEPL